MEELLKTPQAAALEELLKTQQAAALEELVKTPQAAAILDLQPATLEQWRWRGEGPVFVRLSSRAIRYRRSDLKKFIESRRRRSTSDNGEGAGG